jgi:membrane-associated protein
VLDRLLGLSGALVYVIVGLVVFAEDAIFVGFVLPGETAAVLGGVAASQGHVSVVGIAATVVAAAVVGDTVGYEIGARFGVRLLNVRLLQRRQDRIDQARATLARRGGLAVLFGRFVAFFRAVMPFLAGASHMRYGRFLAYNAAGGLLWGVGAVLVGYLAGNSYKAVEHTFGRVTALVVGALGVIGVAVWTIRRRRADKRG